METSSLSEKQMASHGCSQSSPTPSARSAFVPRPPRPRQRGALPRTFAEPASFPQHAGASMQSLAQHISPSAHLNVPPRPFSSSPSQQEGSLKPPMEEQTLPQQPADAPTCPMKEAWQGQFRTQYGVTSQQGGSLNKRKESASLQKGQLPHVGKFSRSWHRVSPQESSQQRGAITCPQGQNSRPEQRGAILPSFQGQALQTPNVRTSSSPWPPVQPTAAMEHTACSSFLQMKFPFSKMWLQLESAIQNRERMLVQMKTEMEKALFEAKVLKDDALKDKEEMEARKAGVRDDMDMISKQTGKIKSVREGLEQISTDLSVQVAELNHWLQQAQEQQRVLKVLESLKDHRDASNDKNSFMFRNLHDCEVKLATMEKELEGSKQTTELLEKAALKWTSDLEDIEAACGSSNYLAKNVFNNTSSELHETAEIFSKTKMDARASGFKGERETLAHSAALKQPKLEILHEGGNYAVNQLQQLGGSGVEEN